MYQGPYDVQHLRLTHHHCNLKGKTPWSIWPSRDDFCCCACPGIVAMLAFSPPGQSATLMKCKSTFFPISLRSSTNWLTSYRSVPMTLANLSASSGLERLRARDLFRWPLLSSKALSRSAKPSVVILPYSCNVTYSLVIKSSSPFILSSRSWTASLIRSLAGCIKTMPAGPAEAKLSARKLVVEVVFLKKYKREEKDQREMKQTRNK